MPTIPPTEAVELVTRRQWLLLGKRVLKAAIAVAVLIAVALQVRRTWLDFRERGQTLHFEPAWLFLTGALYLLGLTCQGIYFWRVLHHSASPVRLGPALRAYLIGHLGKYVPGKALVVLMRVGLITPFGARPATAALTTFYETLVMMLAGGLVGALGMARVHGSFQVVLLGLGLALGFWILVEPRVFRKLAQAMSLPFPNVGPDALPHLSQKLLIEGIAWSIAGWILLGLSQVAVIQSFAPELNIVAIWPQVIAGVALATVLGFVAGLPGGLAARELALTTFLAGPLGNNLAFVASVALRLVWIVAELVISAILYPFGKAARPREAETVLPSHHHHPG